MKKFIKKGSLWVKLILLLVVCLNIGPAGTVFADNPPPNYCYFNGHDKHPCECGRCGVGPGHTPDVYNICTKCRGQPGTNCSDSECSELIQCDDCGCCYTHCGGSAVSSQFSSSSDSLKSTYSLNEFAGSEYRKISVLGRPMPDRKPQREGETDYNREETYVDALTLDLQHDVTDIFVPLASDQLTLSIRRNLMQATYGVVNNVMQSSDQSNVPDDPNSRLLNASQAFGACWSSGLDCGLQIVTAYHYDDSKKTLSVDAGYRTVVMVTDENGQNYRFGVLEDGTFLPLPSTSVSIDVADFSLISNAVNNTYVFTRRYGNEIVFNGTFTLAEGSDVIQKTATGLTIGACAFAIESNKVTRASVATTPVEDYERRERFRPQVVKDRYGNKLVYVFDAGNDGLIPNQIKALSSTQDSTAVSDLTIFVSINMDGNVASVTDPKGNTVSYSYTHSPGNAFAPNGLVLLTHATRDVSGSTVYGYTEKEFEKYMGSYSYNWSWSDGHSGASGNGNGEGSCSIIYHHVALSSVTDANGNSYNFTWKENESVCALEYWTYTVCSNPDQKQDDIRSFEEIIADTSIVWANGTSEAYPLQISSVTHGSGTAAFGGSYAVNLTSPRVLSNDVRRTVVTDMDGNAWEYEFSGALITRSLDRPFLGTIENEGISANCSDAVLFQEMRIYDHNGGHETFNFDPDAGMALRQANDYFSNSTYFAHADEADYSGLGTNANALASRTHLAHYLRRPTKQTDALVQARAYVYEPAFNQKESITNELGRITEFGFDALGNRTNMVKYATNGTTVLSLTEMEYTNSAFPNFMTKKTVKKLSGAGDPAWVTDMVTAYEPHAYGQVGRQIVNPGGLNLTTVYDYDKNNNLIKVIDPNGNMTTNGYDSLNRLTDICFFDDANVLKSSKKFWYDPRGNKTWEKDENGNFSYFEYDSRNNCVKTVRIMDAYSGPASGQTHYAPSTNDIVTISEYNAMGGLTATVDPRGLRTEFQYDHIQRLISSVVGVNLPSGQWQETAYGYDADNCGSLIFNTDGFKPVTVTDPRGYVTTTTYDKLHRPIEVRSLVTNGVETVTQNTYDEVGNLTVVSNQVASGVWQVTRTIYDEQDRPVCVINPAGTSNTVAYTSTGLKWKVTDELGRVSNVEYDNAGRPVKTIAPITNVVTQTGYDANSNVKWVKDANGNVSTNVYDFRNRLVETRSPFVFDAENSVNDRAVVSAAYDAVGNVVSVTDAKGNTTTNFYDRANRLVVIIAPEVFVYDPQSPEPSAQRPATSNSYDKAGNIVATTDANGKTVQMQYDAFGRLTNTVDAVGNTIGFEYDKNGNQVALTDGNTNRTQFVYDGLNRKVSTVYPDANHEDAVYDLLGNRIKRIDCNGAVTHYIYDARNRLDLVRYGSDPSDPDRTRDYIYDDVGNLLDVLELDNQQSTISNACVSYAYDNLNRVISETSAGVEHAYGYDLNGNRTQANYGVTGRSVNWYYDALNRITAIVTDLTDSTALTTYAYDLNSNPIYRQYPTGVEELRTFDAMNRLLTMTTTNGVNGESFSMEYQYDAVGSAREMVQSSWGLSGKAQDTVTMWSYDNRYRLTNETVIVDEASSLVTNSTSYAWDAADNRLSKIVAISTNSTFLTTSTVAYSNNALNQMLGYVEQSVDATPSSRSVTFAYDLNGARTGKTETVSTTSTNSTVLTSYTYDEDNRLVSALSGPNAQSLTPKASFSYDYRSRRYFRSTPTETNLCVFDGGLSVQEYDATQSLTPNAQSLSVEFVRGEGMGGGVGGMVYSLKHETGSSNPELIASHANHRGDIIARSDSTGSLTSFALYEAYGTRPYEWGSDPDRFKANTKQEEKSLGLLCERHRYRDLETGTFLTRDPLGAVDGPNVYCYVHCNPITKFDAFGLAAGDTQEDYQNQMADVQTQIDEIEPQIAAAEELLKNDDFVSGFNELNGRDPTLKDVAGNLPQQLAELNNQKSDISQSMADLKASGWDREGVTSISGATTVNGDPKIKGDISDVFGARGKSFRDPTDSERGSLFKTDANGNLVPKTHEELAKGVTDAINQMANGVDKNLTPAMKTVAYGAAGYVGAPVVGAAGKGLESASRFVGASVDTLYATAVNNGKVAVPLINVIADLVCKVPNTETIPPSVVIDRTVQTIERVIK